MAAEERGLGAAVSGIATTQSAKTPSSTVAGDPLYCAGLVDGAEVTPAMSGWAIIEKLKVTGGGQEFTVAVFERLAAEAGEKSHAVTWGGASRYSAWQIWAGKGADPTTPTASAKGQANGAAKSIKFPSRTPIRAGSLSLIVGLIDQTGTGTPPTNWTEKQDNTVGVYIAIRTNLPLEATGELTAVLTEERATGGFQIIVQPPEEGASAPRQRMSLLGVGA